jgi:sortase (surface protein transpeptidase)
MITPVNTLATGSSDYTRLVNGREIDVNPYLRDGVMVYPGTQSGGYGTVGNTVIFGHSSYYASDSGRYKTHFQKIIELDPDDEVWVYQRQ